MSSAASSTLDAGSVRVSSNAQHAKPSSHLTPNINKHLPGPGGSQITQIYRHDLDVRTDSLAAAA